MSLAALMERLRRTDEASAPVAVTPVTPRAELPLQRKPAWIKACTPVTPVTSLSHEVGRERGAAANDAADDDAIEVARERFEERAAILEYDGGLSPAEAEARAAVELGHADLLRLLLEAAMRACDFHGDGEAAREQMRRDCLGTPPELRGDLLDHFRKTYPN